MICNPLERANPLSVVPKYDFVSDFFMSSQITPCFSLLFTVTMRLSSRLSLLTSTGLCHGFLPPRTVWKVVLGIRGMSKGA